jgi:hypothetical protein
MREIKTYSMHCKFILAVRRLLHKAKQQRCKSHFNQYLLKIKCAKELNDLWNRIWMESSLFAFTQLGGFSFNFERRFRTCVVYMTLTGDTYKALNTVSGRNRITVSLVFTTKNKIHLINSDRYFSHGKG